MSFPHHLGADPLEDLDVHGGERRHATQTPKWRQPPTPMGSCPCLRSARTPSSWPMASWIIVWRSSYLSTSADDAHKSGPAPATAFSMKHATCPPVSIASASHQREQRWWNGSESCGYAPKGLAWGCTDGRKAQITEQCDVAQGLARQLDGLEIRCSIQLSYGGMVTQSLHHKAGARHLPSRNRRVQGFVAPRWRHARGLMPVCR